MEVAYFQMRVAVEKEMVVAVGMYTHSGLVEVGVGEKGFDVVGMVGNAIVV